VQSNWKKETIIKCWKACHEIPYPKEINQITVTYPKWGNKLKTNSIIANGFYNYSITVNPRQRTTYNAGQKCKANSGKF
jgi:hypothetical protein